MRFEIHQQPATIECRFEAVGGGEARAELVTRPDLESIHQHKIHDALASTDTARTASFSQYIDAPGEYAAVIENPGDSPVAARLTVAMRFGEPASRTLSRNRRLTVILITFVLFFAIVSISARALLKAMKRP